MRASPKFKWKYPPARNFDFRFPESTNALLQKLGVSRSGIDRLELELTFLGARPTSKWESPPTVGERKAMLALLHKNATLLIKSLRVCDEYTETLVSAYLGRIAPSRYETKSAGERYKSPMNQFGQDIEHFIAAIDRAKGSRQAREYLFPRSSDMLDDCVCEVLSSCNIKCDEAPKGPRMIILQICLEAAGLPSAEPRNIARRKRRIGKQGTK